MKPSLRQLRRALGSAICVAVAWLVPGCLPDYDRVGGVAPGPLGDAACCSALPGSGCANTVVSECVCAVDSYCCTSEWDSACAAQIAEYGCGSCAGGAVESEGDPGALESECTTDADCGDGLPRCAGGFCVQCREDQHCNAIDAQVPYCGADGFCGECVDDAGCGSLYGDEYPRCRLGLCVECATDDECASGSTCVEGTCG